MQEGSVGAVRESLLRPGTEGDGERRRFRATVEYDGTDFFGFQIQAGERTVQGEIERALRTVTGQRVRVCGAARTDRGVHALGQVVAFGARWTHSLDDLQRALNAVLAADVAVLDLGPAEEGFHPRFSARSRAYRYTILNQRWRSPLSCRRAWHVAQPLDGRVQAEASRCLVGKHDFAAFGRPPRGDNTVRTVFRAEWAEQRPFLTFEIEADAFLNRMVRSIVGCLVQVGSGQMEIEQFEELLRARDRSRVKLVAPAHGLCLVRVEYGASASSVGRRHALPERDMSEGVFQ